jgi:hypothetical protein
VPSDHADLSRVGRNIANAMYQAGGASYTVGGAAATLYPAAGKKVSYKYNRNVSY